MTVVVSAVSEPEPPAGGVQRVMSTDPAALPGFIVSGPPCRPQDGN
jgi:hypothetical protein